jgi:hypothetical protein
MGFSFQAGPDFTNDLYTSEKDVVRRLQTGVLGDDFPLFYLTLTVAC